MGQKAWLHNTLGVALADMTITQEAILIMDMNGKEYFYIRDLTNGDKK